VTVPRQSADFSAHRDGWQPSSFPPHWVPTLTSIRNLNCFFAKPYNTAYLQAQAAELITFSDEG
jgi:hypothetical protein